ncbi:MAG: sigma-54 dependent transcriptional regulator [Melioribacteraceae bacterium]
MNKKSVMIVDDDPAICYAFKKTFETLNYETVEALNGIEAIKKINECEPTLIFMDINMPEMDGLQALEEIKKSHSQIPVVVITGDGNMETAIKAMQIGAYDYLTKPLDIDKVRITASRVIEMIMMRNKIAELQEDLRTKRESKGTNIIGQHPKMQEVYKKIGVIASTPNTTNVFILGESGTGKELVAHVIHEKGSHSDQPFQAINCTVLPENLLESELFGHEKGSFTGADKQKLGKFELAKEGTIFLDEIGDIPESLQKKLLRVIQERFFERLGGNELIPLKARIIAATHIDLKEAIRKGVFREDLYYRLNVMEIKIPPLRERKEDIPLLMNFSLSKYCNRLNKNISGFAVDVIKPLTEYNYPGNVRELENIVERAVALERGEVISIHSLPNEILTYVSKSAIDIPILYKEYVEAKKIIVETFEKKFIVERLRETRGNVSEAARIACIERQSFQRLMKKYNLSSEDFKL